MYCFTYRTDSTKSRDLHLLSTLPQLIVNADGKNVINYVCASYSNIKFMLSVQRLNMCLFPA